MLPKFIQSKGVPFVTSAVFPFANSKSGISTIFPRSFIPTTIAESVHAIAFTLTVPEFAANKEGLLRSLVEMEPSQRIDRTLTLRKTHRRAK
jgi:hypothetical protein